MSGKPKKTDSMNNDLASADVYSKLDQKNVTAWLDLRNKAAHAQYGEYNHDQVQNLLIPLLNLNLRAGKHLRERSISSLRQKKPKR